MNLVKFEELGLADELARAVQEMGFESATPIQAKSIPLIREGGDVIGRDVYKRQMVYSWFKINI